MTLMGERDEERLEEGRMLFAGPVAFLLGVADIAGLPPSFPVEVAFAGRSNVGKSSLINALTGRRDIARVSNTRPWSWNGYVGATLTSRETCVLTCSRNSRSWRLKPWTWAARRRLPTRHSKKD